MATEAGQGEPIEWLMSRPPAVGFLRGLITDRPARRRSPGLAGGLIKYGIGEADLEDAGWVIYKPAHFDKAAAMLKHAREEGAPEPPKGRAQGAPLKMRADLVAVRTLNVGFDMPPGVRFMGMGMQDALQLPHDVVIACESALVLQELASFEWMEEYIHGRKALAIYLGGRGGYQATPALALLRASRAPVLALVDFDAGGLGIAARLPRLEAICMPAWELMEPELASQASNSRSAEHILLHHHILDGIKQPQVAQAWALLKHMGCRMPAEAFPRGRVRGRHPKGQDRQGLVSRLEAVR